VLLQFALGCRHYRNVRHIFTNPPEAKLCVKIWKTWEPYYRPRSLVCNALARKHCVETNMEMCKNMAVDILLKNYVKFKGPVVMVSANFVASLFLYRAFWYICTTQTKEIHYFSKLIFNFSFLLHVQNFVGSSSGRQFYMQHGILYSYMLRWHIYCIYNCLPEDETTRFETCRRQLKLNSN
jgi:hypothetical protein